ncbi:hypothetical protein [Flavobacterium sp.]|uniref:hypothetical protein n=1 Tax=Flavobacterium sp. TaxID=239 RepID=UPI0039E4CA28
MNSFGFGELVIVLLIIIAVNIGVFLIIRELILWYWKINKSIQLQEETNSLLRQILNSQTTTQPNQLNAISDKTELKTDEKLSLNDLYMKKINQNNSKS